MQVVFVRCSKNNDQSDQRDISAQGGCQGQRLSPSCVHAPLGSHTIDG